MRIFTASLFILSFLFATSAPAQTTDWSFSNTGMYGGEITSIFSAGNYLFAGTYNNGVYVSTDNGNNWKTANNGMPRFTNILSITSDGINLYAGTTHGLYVSSDNGATWTGKLQGSVYYQVSALQLVGSSLFIGTYAGISVTTDNGNTSKTVNVGLPLRSGSSQTESINCLAAKETTLFAGVFDKGLYRSKDNGATWAQLTNGFPANSTVRSIIVVGSSVLAASSMGIYVSHDDGDTWLNYAPNWPEYIYVRALAKYGSKIYAGTAFGIYFTADNGSTWQSVNMGVNTSESTQVLHVSGNNIYAGTIQSGVISSRDGGSSWASTITGLTNENIQAMVKKDGSIFAGTQNFKLYESKDQGSTWTVVNGHKQFYYSLTSLTVWGDSLLATASNGVYFSTDSGVNWTFMNYNLGSFSQVYDLMAYKNKIIIGSATGVYQYQPENNLWIPLNTGLPVTTPMVFKVFAKKGILYAGTYSNGLYRSTDDGNTWSAVTLAANATAIRTIASAGNHVVVPSNGKMYFSNDDGNTWQTNSANTVNNEIFTSITVDDSYYFGNSDGVYFSTNHGYTISESNAGMPSTAWVLSLLRDGDKLFAGTSEGVWSVPIAAFSPTITSFSPASAPSKTRVTITGANFDKLPEYNLVKFNGVSAKVISVSLGSLVAEVPSTATKGPISITVAGKTATANSDFCVSPEQPSILVTGLAAGTPTLASTSSTGNQWFLNDTPIEGAINQALNVTKEGIYTVTVTANGCSSLPSDGFSIVVTEIENARDQRLNLSIHPVPTRDNVTINLDRFNANKDVHIQIVNSLGQEIYVHETNASNDLSVDVSRYINGIYFVKARQGNIFLTGRFIKK